VPAGRTDADGGVVAAPEPAGEIDCWRARDDSNVRPLPSEGAHQINYLRGVILRLRVAVRRISYALTREYHLAAIAATHDALERP